MTNVKEMSGAPEQTDAQDTFTLWATSDAHVVREALAESCDPLAVPRESVKVALDHADGPDGFHYDIGLHLGDLLDYDHETVASFRQYLGQLDRGSKDRHAWYHVGGNNDENSVLNDGVAIDNEYYRQTIDPVGEFPALSGMDNARRPYPVTGTYERYHIDVGNMRMLFLHDRNDLPAPYGRGEGGFYVDGAVTLDTYRWLVNQVITNPDRILVVCCHHPLKDTTIGSAIDDSWRGQFMTKRLKRSEREPEPKKRLQTVLHQVYDVDPFDSPKFRNLLGQNSGVVDIWLSGHVHHLLDETFEGKGKYAHAFGGHHMNVGTLCRYRHQVNVISAQSTLLTFRQGSAEFESRVYVHDHPSIPPGFYPPEHRRLAVKMPFSRSCSADRLASTPANIEKLSVTRPASGQLDVTWRNAATGLLVVRKVGTPPTFIPTDGKSYYVGEQVGDGEVAFIGVNERLSESAPQSGEPVYYKAFAYDAGNGAIRYCANDMGVDAVADSAAGIPHK